MSDYSEYAKFQFIQLHQKLRGSPQIIKVYSKNGTTIYKFKKFSIEARTESMMCFERWTNEIITATFSSGSSTITFGMRGK